jgi:hypothetical protein
MGKSLSFVRPYSDFLSMRKIVLAFAFALAPISAFAESPIDDLSNDKVLGML